MKFLQSSACALLLAVTAAAQTTPPAAPPPPPAAAPKPMPLTSLGGDPVKGPEHPLTLDQMKVIYDAMDYQKTIDQNLETMLTTQKSRAAFIPASFWDDLQASFKKIDYSAAFLDVYKKYLSTEDAAKVIEFSKTEAGKHFFESVPAASREVTMAVQRQQQTVGQEVQARHKDEIDAALKKYREEHQPKPAPTLGAPTPATGATPAPDSKPATPPATPPASTAPQN